MSNNFELQLTCPVCGTEFETLGHTLVDASDSEDSDILALLQEGNLNVATCPKCSSAGLVPVPVIYHDAERELLLAFVPNAQEMDEETLGQTIGPVLQTFITQIPEEQRSDYLFHPIVTDDPTALQAASNGEVIGEDYEEGDEIEDDNEDSEGEDEELSEEEQLELSKRVELLQALFEMPDSLQRISTLREYKYLVDDLFQQMLEVLLQQAEQAQPQALAGLQKIQNEVEVFRASIPS